MNPIRFTVRDTRPAPQGSKRVFAMRDKHTGKHKAVMVEASKALKPYRQAVTAVARTVAPPTPITSPVALRVEFVFQRPKSHLNAEGAPKRSAPLHATGGVGDLSKLIRAVEDAITDAGVWKDDRLVVQVTASKSYGEWNETRVEILGCVGAST